MSSWLDKIKQKSIRSDAQVKGNIPEAEWKNFQKCKVVLMGPELKKNLKFGPQFNLLFGILPGVQ